MLNKTVTFENLEGDEVSQTFYFNFNKLEIMELELSLKDGIEGTLKRLSQTQDAMEAYELFKNIILNAYGKKDPNGVDFYKKDPDTGRLYRYELEASPALGEIILEFIENSEAGAKFIEQTLPKKLVREALAAQSKTTPEEVSKMVEEAGARQANPETAVPPGHFVDEEGDLVELQSVAPKSFEDYDRNELLSMSQENFEALVGTDASKMSREQLMVAMQRKNAAPQQ